MNQRCQFCKSELDNHQNALLVRTYHSKCQYPKALHVLGTLDVNGDFLPEEEPDFRGIKYDLNIEDFCLGCINKGPKWLRLPLYANEGHEALPSYLFVKVDASEVADLIRAQNDLKASRFHTALQNNESVFLLASDEEEAFDLEAIQQMHDEFIDREGVYDMTLETRLGNNNDLVLSVTASVHKEMYEGVSQAFKIEKLLELEHSDFVIVR